MISFFNGRRRTLGGQTTSEVYAQVWVDFRDYLHFFKGAKLHVFLSIALHANEDGWSWPSWNLIQRETGYSPETVRKALGELCSMEVEGHRVLLRYQPHKAESGKFDSNRYLIFPDAEEVAKYEGLGVVHLGHMSGGGFDERPSCKNTTTVDRGSKRLKDRGGKTPPQTNTIEEAPYDDAVVSDLIGLGIEPVVARSLAQNCTPEHVRGWVQYAQSCSDLKNPAGLVVSRLKAGEPVPNDGRPQDSHRRRFLEGPFSDYIQH